MKSACVALLLILSLLTGSVYAKIYVDDDAPGDPAPRNPQIGNPNEDGSAERPFDEIQEAIDAAGDGDTIVVDPGRYLSLDPWAYGELHFKGKNIRLVSRSPTNLGLADATILCGVVVFDGTEGPECLLQGFKIQNHNYGGILGNNTLATISHCILSGNGPCGATVLKDVRGRIANCLIVDNTTFHDCGVMPVVAGCWEFVNCTIANNLSGIGLGNMDLPEGGTVRIHNCIIYGNQGDQFVYYANRATDNAGRIEYSLIQDAGSGYAPFPRIVHSNLIEGDPGFVRWGRWEDASSTRRTTLAVASANQVLIEGDYHLMSQGWRWGAEWGHGSFWYFDAVTSPGVDAGDPLDSLGKEPERADEDPEGRWGFNHAIDLGAYGGTMQASLSPTWGVAPGIGAVDLRDFWPFGGRYRWVVSNPARTTRQFRVVGQSYAIYNERSTVSYWIFETTNDPDWVTKFYLFYFDRTLYMTQDLTPLTLLPDTSPFRALYPGYPVVGSTVEVPFDPFVKETPEYRSVVVVRGTLEEVLADTAADPNQFLAGSWHDVIALREAQADGTPGEPITIFARGFGPLMLAGQPIVQAELVPSPARR